MTPRTETDMISELYDAAKEYEWIEHQSLYSWGGSESHIRCHHCSRSKEKGHEDDCYLNNLFRVKGYLVENDLHRRSK